MNKLNLGIIGTGMALERLHWPALQELKDKYKIIALCDEKKEKAEKFAGKINLGSENIYQNYREMLKRNDIDAVDLMVPIEDNFDVAKAVVEAGIDLIAEKPLAATLEGAEKLLELHQQYNVKIMVAENYRYNEEINKIRDIINQGQIGEIVYFIKNKVVDLENEMKKNTFAATEWRQHPEYRGGAILDAGIHDIAGFRHIFGEVDEVYAMGRPQQEDFSPYMSVNSQILFNNGIIGHFSYFTDGKETQRPLIGLRIFGTEGEIYLEEKKCGVINLSYKNGGSEQIQYQPERGYYNELLNFYNAWTGQEEISVTPEVEYGDIKMIFDILNSIEENQPQKVDQKIRETTLV
ncbi:MAG: Gfo/Idh/MocA family protein [Halanaerobiaceae bacterium]